MLVRRKYLGESAVLQKHVDYSRLISIAEVAGVQQEVILIDDVNNVLISKEYGGLINVHINQTRR